ncbi:MAG: carboxyltransferase domain-containing protein [Ilumatobacteraceae bacterium]
MAGVRIGLAARTVLVVHDGGVDRAVLDAVLADVAPVELDHGDLVEIGVVYDGADLAEVVARSGGPSTTSSPVTRRSSTALAFCGFVPGFAYLVGLPAELHVPRLGHRGRVSTPVRWRSRWAGCTRRRRRVVGGCSRHTDAVMWDEARARPSLLEPGMRVRFVAR